jgi:hypothetical protein
LGGAGMREFAIILPQELYEAYYASTNKHTNNNFLNFFFSLSTKEYTTGFT